MSKSGFVQAVKSKGYYYYYVRISYRDEEKKPRNKNLIGLGQKENALLLINSWINNKALVPEVLNKYNIEDFYKWISYIESK